MIHTVAVLRRAALVAVTAALLAVGGCSDDGRELAPPRPGQTTTTAAATTTTGPDGTVFAVTSSAFPDGDALPVRFTCHSETGGISPPLSWTPPPPGTAELAIVVRDRDADGFVHWIVTGIDPVITGFGEGGVPEGAVEQVNATGALGWLPACPPEGDARHVYEITLHALTQPVDVDPEAPAAEVAAQIEEAANASVRLLGTVIS